MPITYLVIAVFSAAGVPTYFAAPAPHCATDLGEIGPQIIAEAKREKIHVEIECSRDPKFAARAFVTVDMLKAEIQKRAKP